MSTFKMTPTKPKARKPWTCSAYLTHGKWKRGKVRCIPLDAASVEALRERLMVALNAHHGWSGQYVLSFRGDADAVLAALGIKRRKNK